MKIDNENIRYIYCYYKHNKELYQCVPAIYRPKEFNDNIKKFTKQFDSILFKDGLNLNKAIQRTKKMMRLSYEANLAVSKFSELSEIDLNTITRKLNLRKPDYKKQEKRKYTTPKERASNLKLYLYDTETREVLEFENIRESIYFLKLKNDYKVAYSYVYGTAISKSKLQNRYYVNFTNDFTFLNDVFYKFHIYDGFTNKTYNNLSLKETLKIILKHNKKGESSAMYDAIKHKRFLYKRFLISYKDDINRENFPKLDKYLNKKL